MPLHISPPKSLAVVSWTYLIPIAVLIFAFVLSMTLLQNFERAVEVLAPVLLGVCALCVIAGMVYCTFAMRNAQRRAHRYSELTAIVDDLAAGRIPRDAHWIGDTWRALEAVRAITADRPRHELELVCAGLRELGVGKRVAVRALKSRRKWERVRAIQDLGWLDDPSALPILYRSLADADNDIAWSAVAALGAMSDPITDQVLLELLDDGRFAASRIADVLDAHRHHRPVSVLQERARASSDSSLFWIAYLLGRSFQPSALNPLLELARHSSPDVRAAAAEGIGRLGSQDAVDTLLRMVSDDVWYVRLHASRSLGDLAAKSGVRALQTATLDSSWWVRRSALESLRRLREAV
jgi:hypothetical protein